MVVDSNVNSSKTCLKCIDKILNLKKLSNKNIFFIKGDIRDEIFLKNVFIKALNDGFPIEGVIHFAGLKSVEESMRNPLLYWDNNLVGTINLLKVMEILGVKL